PGVSTLPPWGRPRGREVDPGTPDDWVDRGLMPLSACLASLRARPDRSGWALPRVRRQMSTPRYRWCTRCFTKFFSSTTYPHDRPQHRVLRGAVVHSGVHKLVGQT